MPRLVHLKPRSERFGNCAKNSRFDSSGPNSSVHKPDALNFSRNPKLALLVGLASFSIGSIMRLLSSFLFHTTVLAALSTPLACFAADAASSAPSSAPPTIEKLDEGPDAALGMKKPEPARKVTEKKVNGKVSEVQVKNGKSQYVVKANSNVGNAVPGETTNNQVRGAQWSVMEFDLGKKKNPEKDGKDTDTPPPEAKPASASAKSKK